MTAAYTFTGSDARTYPWGVASPGDIAYFTHRPPDGDWMLHEAAASPAGEPDPTESTKDTKDTEDTEDTEGGELTAGDGELKRPGKAASAADWVAYAKAEGSFPGDPDTATRKAIVDHYVTGEGE